MDVKWEVTLAQVDALTSRLQISTYFSYKTGKILFSVVAYCLYSLFLFWLFFFLGNFSILTTQLIPSKETTQFIMETLWMQPNIGCLLVARIVVASPCLVFV